MSNGTSTSTSIATGGAAGGALSILITWISRVFFQYEMPAEVAGAMATLLVILGGWIGKKF